MNDRKTGGGELDELDALAVLSEALPETAPPAASRVRLLTQLRGAARLVPFASEIAATFQAPLEAVLAALARIDDLNAWVGPETGGRILPVHERTIISRLPAGTRIPRHGHATRELTYVLDGVLISDDVEYRRGACLDMLPGSTHALRIDDADGCLVVFASLLA